MSYITSNSKIVTHNSKWITTDYVPPTPPQILDMPMAFNSSGSNPSGCRVYDWKYNLNLVGTLFRADVPSAESSDMIHVTKVDLPDTQLISITDNSTMDWYHYYWRKANEYPYGGDAAGDNYMEVYMGLFLVNVSPMTSAPYGWRGANSTTNNICRLLWSYPTGKRIRDYWDSHPVLFFGGTYGANFTVKKGAQIMAALFAGKSGAGPYILHYDQSAADPQLYPYNNNDPLPSSYKLKLYYEPEA